MSLKIGPTLFIVALFLIFGLAFALFSEKYFHVDPCSMCYTQRDLYKLAILCCLISAFFVRTFNLIKYIALISVLMALLYSFYHVGVEQKWWPGPKTCQSHESTLNINNLSEEDALKQLEGHLEKKKFVPCDQITWRIFSIPATIWDTLYLLFLFTLTLIACFSCQQKAYKQLFRR
ncbi:MAG: disulfide bond formation protein B [Proteobacteria bacterium]|nr:disulfide bond formation protein B [Pseudomonadota bacterium]